MRSIRYCWLLIGLFVWAGAARAQTRVSGQVYALTYVWEDNQAERQWDHYQGLLLRVQPAGRDDFSFKTNLRLARLGGPGEWDERIYNTYLDWGRGAAQARVGRQFVYRGVVNGSVDGLSFRAAPVRNLDLQFVGGAAVPYDRAFRVQTDAAVLGGYVAYRFGAPARLEVSYVQRARHDAMAWQQVGGALTGAWAERLFYQAQFEYNLLKDAYQGMRYRLTYQPGRFSVFGEYGSQKPRVYEDSFFNRFELVAFDQVRGGATYRIGRYQLGAQYLHTMYDRAGDTADEVIVTVGGSWGTVGLIYQDGYGGDNVGFYGSAQYDALENLTFRAHSSYYNYQRRSLAFGEDAVAFSGGLLYRPIPSLLLQAEVQQRMNSFYANDLRGLFRASYAIGRP